MDTAMNTSPSGTESLQSILDDLNASCLDIQLSMIVTSDGLTMVSVGEPVDADRVGAMCADLLSLCRSAALELKRGEVEQFLLKCRDGCMLLTPAGPQAVLAIMTRARANLGMVLLDAAHAAETIPKAL
jgi:hypothetical protein